MKFGHLIEHNKRNTFFQKLCKNQAERLDLDLSLFFKKALHEVKASGIPVSFNIF